MIANGKSFPTALDSEASLLKVDEFVKKKSNVGNDDKNSAKGLTSPHLLLISAGILGVVFRQVHWATALLGLILASMSMICANLDYQSASRRMKPFVILGRILAGEGIRFDSGLQPRVRVSATANGHHRSSENGNGQLAFANIVNGQLNDLKKEKVCKLSDIEVTEEEASGHLIHEKYGWRMFLAVSILLPALAPVFLWEESLIKSVSIVALRVVASRYMVVVIRKNPVENGAVNANGVSKIEESSPVLLSKKLFQADIVWRNVIVFIYLHVGSLYAIYLLFTYAQRKTLFFALAYGTIGSMGITAGAHRLWSHRSYKATWQLRLLLTILQTIAFQNHIYEWSRDHRAHHKFTETDADPHNAKRGFFFSHIGWLCLRKHPDVISKGKLMDLSDLEEDKIVMWQKKYFLLLMPILTFIIPTLIPYLCWGEGLSTAWFVAGVWRYTVTLNGTWLVNSAAHLWGTRPYDSSINPCENRFVAAIANGEGWHNYHHVFPWDYKAAELGYFRINLTTSFINLFAKIGWAYDLKSVSDDWVKRRVKRTGDGTHRKWGEKTQGADDVAHHVWGWDDDEMCEEDKKQATIMNQE